MINDSKNMEARSYSSCALHIRIMRSCYLTNSKLIPITSGSTLNMTMASSGFGHKLISTRLIVNIFITVFYILTVLAKLTAFNAFCRFSSGWWSKYTFASSLNVLAWSGFDNQTLSFIICFLLHCLWCNKYYTTMNIVT